MKDFTTIAEIGCTHIGSLDRAKELALLAKISGADILKTQKRNPKESTKKELWDKPHPNQMFSYGKTYLEHRENVELSIKEHAELKSYCESIGIEYSTSVWDITSANEIMSIKPKSIKIPSALNQSYDLIEMLLNKFDGTIYISNGMLNHNERLQLENYLIPFRDRIVLFHCTSGYPVPFENLYLLDISSMTKNLPNIGFSNHGYGIAMEPIAYSLGARFFERHFIDDRMFRHTDAACSLEPQGLSKMIRDLKATQKALSHKPFNIDELEKEQKNKLQIKN